MINLTYTDSCSNTSKYSSKSINEKKRDMKIYFGKEEYYDGNVDSNFTINGVGTYTYANGDVYFGDFVDNQRNGIGEYKYSDGTIYYGQWLNDKKHGFGHLVNEKENFEFFGQFQNDQPLTGMVSNEIDLPNRNWISADENQEETKDTSLQDLTKEDSIVSKFVNEMKRKLTHVHTMGPLSQKESVRVFNKVDNQICLIQKGKDTISCMDIVSQLRLKCNTCLLNTKKKSNSNDECCGNLRKMTKQLSIS